MKTRETQKMKSFPDTVKSAPITNRRRISHLYLQEKKIKIIPKLNKPRDTIVLYLYGNVIQKIENLSNFANLECLYLQNNQISVLENLHHLKKLKKLYIGRNKISVLEGLASNTLLEELHIEKQYISEGSSLCFDPRCVMMLTNCLHLLNISHNNITSISILFTLRNLRSINASYNDLDDIKEVCEAVENWPYLEEATFLGNPIAKRHRYREDLIAKSHNLVILDGKRVSDVTRSFMRRFQVERMSKGSKLNINISEMVDGISHYPLGLKKAVSASLVRQSGNQLDDLSTFDEKDAVYIAWKALPKRRPYAKCTQQEKKPADFVKKTLFVNSLPHL